MAHIETGRCLLMPPCAALRRSGRRQSGSSIEDGIGGGRDLGKGSNLVTDSSWFRIDAAGERKQNRSLVRWRSTSCKYKVARIII